jgi:hypothetical protein
MSTEWLKFSILYCLLICSYVQVTSTMKQMKHFDTTSKPAIDFDDDIDDEEDNEDDYDYDQNDEDEDEDEDEIETQSLYNTKSALISATGADSNFDTYASPDLLDNEKILLKLGKKLNDIAGSAAGGKSSGSIVLRNKTYSTATTTSTTPGKLPPYYYINQNGVNRSAIYNHQSKYISSADSMLSRNNTSSKMLKSTISLTKQTSIDESLNRANKKADGSTKTNHGNKQPQDNDVEVSALTTGNNPTAIDENPVSGDDDTLSLLQKQINFIMAHGAFSGEDEPNSSNINEERTGGSEVQAESSLEQTTTQLKQIKGFNYKKLPPKFHTLYNSSKHLRLPFL